MNITDLFKRRKTAEPAAVRIYAIRDRMIDYYQTPFAAHNDDLVKASMAVHVNSEEINAITQAPHHFEIWCLGEVDNQGNLTAKREYLCDCSSLVRIRLREDEARKPGSEPAESAANARTGPNSGDRGHPATGGNPPDATAA